MRVLVCRARTESLRIAALLEQAGHEAVIAPVIDIVPLTVELPAAPPDIVIATSAQALEWLAPENIAGLAAHPLFAVGRMTAEAARALGFVDIRTAAGNVAALADLIVKTIPPRTQLLYLAGAIRKPDLERRLAGTAYDLRVVETYEAREARPWAPSVIDALASGTLDAALHYSERSATLALAFADGGGVGDALLGLRHLCLSEQIADVLRRAGAFRVEIPGKPGRSDLVTALDHG